MTTAAGTLLHPGRHPGRRFRFPTRRRAYAQAPIAGIGAATFVLSLEPGTKVTYSWPCDIVRSYSGREQRISVGDGRPRIRIEGSAFLVDAKDRDIRGILMRAAAQGSVFALALPFEELLFTADASGLTVTVASTVQCDWAVTGQRCVVMGRDGSLVTAIIQGVSTTTISVAIVDSTGLAISSTLGTAGLAGGRIMPVIQVVLDPQQGFTRLPFGAGYWQIRATAVAFGWGGVDSMGVGASITTFTAGAPVAVAGLTDAELLIWDRTNELAGTATETVLAGTELIDLGGVAFTLGAQPAPDWVIPLRLRSAQRDDWAYCKAFLRQVRGRQRSFGLSTGRADFTFLSTNPDGSGIKIASAAVAGGGDYVSWFASGAYRRLALTLSDGTVQYVTVLAAVDNGDGTSSLTLQGGFLGTVTKISLLEQVRIDNGESDDIAVTWTSHMFTLDTTVRATQEAITTPLRLLYDTVIEFAWNFPPQTFPNLPITWTAALGAVTLFNFTGNNTLDINGIHAIGGNVDGMIVTFSHTMPIGSSPGLNLRLDDTGAIASDRIRAPASGFGGLGPGGAMTVRYNAAIQRWYIITNIS